MQVERESLISVGRVKWRTGEERVDDLPLSLGQPCESGANTGYDHAFGCDESWPLEEANARG